jgi:choline dehydrogenase
LSAVVASTHGPTVFRFCLETPSKKIPLQKNSESLPLAHANQRTVTLIQAEALGGGSRVNAMNCTRGVPGVYNHWRDLGHPNWSYEKMKPYYIKSENSLNQPLSDFRGKNGE